MIVIPRLEFSGGTPVTALLSVEPHQIVVAAYHPNRSQLQELARVADLVVESMGTEEKPSLSLVLALEEKMRGRLAPMVGKEVTHVERN